MNNSTTSHHHIYLWHGQTEKKEKKVISIFIIHAPDGLKEAQNIKDTLVSRGITVNTLSELKADNPTKSTMDVCSMAFTSHGYVISLVSTGLFQNCSLVQAVRLAVGLEAKIVSVTPYASDVIVPIWYSHLFPKSTLSLAEAIDSLN